MASKEITLRNEYENQVATLTQELKDANEAVSAATAQKSAEPTMSNFTRNLLQNKDDEISHQKTTLSQLEEKMWNVEQELKLATGKLIQNVEERDAMEGEISSLKQARERAEANVIELKDKLREEVTKHQQTKAQNEASSGDQPNTNRVTAKERYQEDTVDKAKYEELLGAVLGLELAQDPLSDMNLSLQQSFIDDLEQATGHLDEQRRIVNAKIETQEAELETLRGQIDTIRQEKDELMQIAQKDHRTAQDIKVELDSHVSENLRLKQSIIELENKVQEQQDFEVAKEDDDVVSVSPISVAENQTPRVDRESS